MTIKECVPVDQNKPVKSKSPVKPKPRVTKRDQLIKLLRGRQGISNEAISKKLNWQAHTTRAALSGLRNSGIVIEKLTSSMSGATRYHIENNTDTSAKS